MSGEEEPHLSQRQEHEHIEGILTDLSIFLTEKAEFEKLGDGAESCKDKGLPKACKHLFEVLGFDKKVKVSGLVDGRH